MMCAARDARGPGNFDSQEAMCSLDEWLDELVAEVEDILSSGDEADPDRQGEGRLMPAVALIVASGEASGEMPIDPDDVRRWRSQYLTRFQARGGRLFADPAAYEQRLQVIIDTFSRLEELACRAFPEFAVDEGRPAN